MRISIVISLFLSIVVAYGQVDDRNFSIDCENYDLWAMDREGYIHQYKEGFWNVDSIVGQTPHAGCLAIGFDHNGVSTFLTHRGGDYYSYTNGVWNHMFIGSTLGKNMGAHRNYKYTVATHHNAIEAIDSTNQFYTLAAFNGEEIFGKDVAVDSIGNAWVITGSGALHPCVLLYVVDAQGYVIAHYFFPNHLDHIWFDGLAIVGNTLYGSTGFNELYKLELVNGFVYPTFEAHLNIGIYEVGDLASCKPGNPGGFIPSTPLSNNYTDELKGIIVYPNPANSIVTIDGVKELDILITSLDGKLIHSEKSTRNSCQIDVKNMSSGMYIISILKDEQIIKTQKLTINN